MSPVQISCSHEAPWVVDPHSQACTFTSHATLKVTDGCCRTHAINLDIYCARKSLPGIRTLTSLSDVDVRVMCGRVSVGVCALHALCATDCDVEVVSCCDVVYCVVHVGWLACPEILYGQMQLRVVLWLLFCRSLSPFSSHHFLLSASVRAHVAAACCTPPQAHHLNPAPENLAYGCPSSFVTVTGLYSATVAQVKVTEMSLFANRFLPIQQGNCKGFRNLPHLSVPATVKLSRQLSTTQSHPTAPCLPLARSTVSRVPTYEPNKINKD